MCKRRANSRQNNFRSGMRTRNDLRRSYAPGRIRWKGRRMTSDGGRHRRISAAMKKGRNNNMERYKFLITSIGNRIVSNADYNCVWQIGQWQRLIRRQPDLCAYGFHCSGKLFDALCYVAGEIVARVEVAGLCDKDADKEAWQEMRIIEAWHWRKEDSVALAIYAAELVIDFYEMEYPKDDRPRKAIEAAKTWLENPSSAAAAARAADAAAYARAAARAAAAAADAA